MIFLLVVCVASVLSYAQQQGLRGVDFTNLHLAKSDSMLLYKNSVMYSGWGKYGEETDGKVTIYPKWSNNKEKYYPVMREAWKYCIANVPYQLRLYKDGALFYQWMIDAAKDSVERTKYSQELMALYDTHIQNLDSINAYVRRVSDRTSKGNMMMRKALVYEWYVLGKPKEGEEYYTEQRKAIMYPMYKDAVNVIKKTFDEGSDNGGDVDITALQTYFLYAFYNWMDIFNAHLGNDSISKKIRSDASNTFLDEYGFLRDFCDRQIQDLGADYVDTLSVDTLDKAMSDSLAVMQEKVVAPYKNLMAFCNENIGVLENATHMSVNIRTLADAESAFYDDLQSHKDSLQWLYRVKTLCENATDFDPDNMFYSFYEDVDKYYTAALEKAKTSGTTSQNLVKKMGGNEFYAKAKPLYDRVVAFSKSGRSSMDNATFNSGLLCIYYLNQAIRTDPGNASKYMKYKAWVSKGVSTEAFFKGVKRRQTVTVNGVTFTATW